jgi:hypothetical protein
MADELSPKERAEQPLVLQSILHGLQRLHVDNAHLRQSRRLTLQRARTPEQIERANVEIAFTVTMEYELNRVIAHVEQRRAEIMAAAAQAA